MDCKNVGRGYRGQSAYQRATHNESADLFAVAARIRQVADTLAVALFMVAGLGKSFATGALSTQAGCLAG